MATTPSNFHFYTKLFTDLDAALSTYVSDTAINIIDAITPVATTLLGVYVALWGWAMIRGVISEPITDGVNRIVRLALITGIALNIGYYNQFLSDFLWQSPDALAAYIGDSSPASNVSFLDSLISKMFDFGETYYQKAYAGAIVFPRMGLLITAFALWGAGIAASGYAAFLLALAKMGLAIALGVGPLFVLLTMFEPTKRFFDAWLGQTLNYVFMVMLASAAIKLIMAILEKYLNDASGMSADPTLDQAVPAIVFSLIGALVMIQMPAMASALGGGVALGTLGAVGWALNKMNGAAGSTANLVSGKTLSDMRAQRRAKQMNARWAANNPGMASRAAGAPMAVYRKITGGTKNRISKR